MFYASKNVIKMTIVRERYTFVIFSLFRMRILKSTFFAYVKVGFVVCVWSLS